jgi:hypothetical protein
MQPKQVKVKHLKAANRYEALLGFINEFTMVSDREAAGKALKDLVALVDRNGLVSDEVLNEVARLQRVQVLTPGLFGQLTILNREVRDILAGLAAGKDPEKEEPEVDEVLDQTAEEILEEIETSDDLPSEEQVDEFLAALNAEPEEESAKEEPEEPAEEEAPSEPEPEPEEPAAEEEPTTPPEVVTRGPADDNIDLAKHVHHFQPFAGYPMLEDGESFLIPLGDSTFIATLETEDRDGKPYPIPPEVRFKKRTKALTFLEVVGFKMRTKEGHQAVAAAHGLDAKAFEFQWKSFAGTDWNKRDGYYLVQMDDQWQLMAARP